MKEKLTPSRVIFNIFNYTFFALCVLMCVFPLWYVFSYTVSDPVAVEKSVLVLYPKGFSLSNIRKVLSLSGFSHAAFISVARTVTGTLLAVFGNTWMGYLFTKERFPARRFFYRFVVISMYVSGGMIPTFLVYKYYGLLNNFLVYIIPGMVSAYNIILCKTYTESIPASLEESAYLDGAGPFTTYVKIIFPLSLPIAATIGIYAAVGQWNSWFDNHIYTFSVPNLTTLQYLMYTYLNEAQQLANLLESTHMEDIEAAEQMITPWGIKMTVTMLTIMPILMVYPFLQKYFIKGIMVGAVKG